MNLLNIHSVALRTIEHRDTHASRDQRSRASGEALTHARQATERQPKQSSTTTTNFQRVLDSGRRLSVDKPAANPLTPQIDPSSRAQQPIYGAVPPWQVIENTANPPTKPNPKRRHKR